MFVESIVFGFWILLVLGVIAWLIGAGVMAGGAISGLPRLLDEALDYRGQRCACYLGLHQHTRPQNLQKAAFTPASPYHH